MNLVPLISLRRSVLLGAFLVILTGNAAAAPPSILTGFTILTEEDISAGSFVFEASDPDTPPENLKVQAVSHHETLLPTSRIAVERIHTGTITAAWRVTFTPLTNQHGDAVISITISDDSATVSQDFMVSVTPKNDAPVLENGGNIIPDPNKDMGFAIMEWEDPEDADGWGNPSDAQGKTVLELISSSRVSSLPITDVDGDSIGIAVIAIKDTDTTGAKAGEWQYSIDSGVTWNAIGWVSEFSALVLGAEDRIRFQPKGNWNGVIGDGLIIKAWDRTDNHLVGTRVNTVRPAGTPDAPKDETAFSNDTEFVGLTVFPVNDAPVAANGLVAYFRDISEDPDPDALNGVTIFTPNPNHPMRVSELTSSGLDVDGDQIGIAVIRTNPANGKWQYRFSRTGSGWQDMGSVSENAALLLAPTVEIRFVPNPNYFTASGASTDSIVFRLWDQTQGLNGEIFHITQTGGTSAFSRETGTGVIRVNPMNDAPVLDNSEVMVLNSMQGNTVAAVIANTPDGKERIRDIDGDSIGAIAVVKSDNSNGQWEYDIGDGWKPLGSITLPLSDTNAILLFPTSQIRYTSNSAAVKQASLEVRAWDRTDGKPNGSTGVSVFTRTGRNDAAGDTTPYSAAVGQIRLSTPSANPDSYATAQNTTLSVPAPGVLTNDTDPEGDSLTAILINPPAHGRLELNSNGSFVYIPDKNYQGTDAFTYAAKDESTTSNEASVAIVITAPPIPSEPDKPVFEIPVNPGILKTEKLEIIRLNAPSDCGKDYCSTQSSRIVKLVGGLSVTGEFLLEKEDPNSFVRIVLIDDSTRKEYLVFQKIPAELTESETHASTPIPIQSVCEETCLLPELVYGFYLRLEARNALIVIRELSFVERPITGDPVTLRIQQNAEKIAEINQNQAIEWIAGETAVSSLPYEQKKRLVNLMSTDAEFNLNGFEYYRGGVFQFTNASKTSMSNRKPLNSSSTSLLAAERQPLTGGSSGTVQFDWTDRRGINWITPVKDQNPCGSCWAFGALGAVEAVAKLYWNQPNLKMDLSEQDLVCNTPSTTAGEKLCGGPKSIGKFPGTALEYVRANGIVFEDCLIYPRKDQYCSNPESPYMPCTTCTNPVRIKIAGSKTYNRKGFEGGVYETVTDERIKQLLIEKGPLVMSLMQTAGSGHVMLLVGFKSDSSGDTIWTLKNSYGACWGATDKLNESVSWRYQAYTASANCSFCDSGVGGYAHVKIDFDSMQSVLLHEIQLPITISDGSVKVNCEDKDKDGYCNWGISGTKPVDCPSCKSRDCDDNDPSLTAYDPSNCRCTDTCPKDYPFADFTISPGAVGRVPFKVTLDAGASRSPSGSITAYLWEIVKLDGTGARVQKTDKQFSHEFTQAGAFVTTLTVTNNSGFSDKKQRVITVVAAASSGTDGGGGGGCFISTVP